jgi:hypothetical protein
VFVRAKRVQDRTKTTRIEHDRENFTFGFPQAVYAGIMGRNNSYLIEIVYFIIP